MHREPVATGMYVDTEAGNWIAPLQGQVLDWRCDQVAKEQLGTERQFEQFEHFPPLLFLLYILHLSEL